MDGGLEIDSEVLVSDALRAGCEAIVITTHNGWALDFGERLSRALRRHGAEHVTLVMGGKLNQDTGIGANDPMPRDVTDELQAMGIVTTSDTVELVKTLHKIRQ